jgi:hypothetical protein
MFQEPKDANKKNPRRIDPNWRWAFWRLCPSDLPGLCYGAGIESWLEQKKGGELMSIRVEGGPGAFPFV